MTASHRRSRRPEAAMAEEAPAGVPEAALGDGGHLAGEPAHGADDLFDDLGADTPCSPSLDELMPTSTSSMT